MVIPGLNIEMNLAHAWVMIDGLKTISYIHKQDRLHMILRLESIFPSDY